MLKNIMKSRKRRRNLPVLYNSKKDMENSGLGLGVLSDCLRCVVTEVRNGIFELELEYPSDGILAEELHISKIIRANASKKLRKQPFRIYDVKRSITGKITVYAEHTFFDLRKAFVPRISLNDKVDAYRALALILNSTNVADDYIGASDIDTEHFVRYELKNALECIVGGEGSLVDTWRGGELLRDRQYIHFKKNRGADNGVRVTYKKNMTGFEAVENLDAVITAIYPYVLIEKAVDTENFKEGTDGSIITGEESVYIKNDVLEVAGVDKYVYADNYRDFDTVFSTGVDFTNDEFWDKYAKDPTNLRILAERYIKDTKCNIPKTTYEVDLIALADTEEYEDKYAILEEVNLCDIVTVDNKKYNIKDKVKVTELKFDTLTDRVISLKLGGESNSIESQIQGQIDKVKEEVESNKSEAEKVIEYVTSQITGNQGGHVKLFPPHNPQEIFILNDPDPMQATEVLRINKKGIGFGKSINGPFETAWTADGVFNANFIKVGELSANLIRTGVLSNKSGTVQIDLNGNSVNFLADFQGQLLNAITLHGTTMSFHDTYVSNAIAGNLIVGRFIGSNGEPEYFPSVSFMNEMDGYLGISYRKNDGVHYAHYAMFDKYNRSGKNTPGYTATIFEPTYMGGLLCARNGVRVLPQEEAFLYYSRGGHTVLRGSKVGGLALVNYWGDTILNFGIDGLISMHDNYFYNSIKMKNGSKIYYSTAGNTVIDNNSAVILAIGTYSVLKVQSDKILAWQNLNMQGRTIENAYIQNTYTNAKTRKVVNTYASQSLQEEVSYTYESRTKGKTIKIDLNKNMEAFTKNDYMVQLTAYDDCKIWCKKHDGYFIVHTSAEDVEFCCRVIKKIDRSVEPLRAREVENLKNEEIEEDFNYNYEVSLENEEELLRRATFRKEE